MVKFNNIPNYAQPVQGFQPLKAVQLCAAFVSLSGGHIEKLKLIKLIYLTERSFILRYSEPILWDEFFSLPHGPICSSTLNLIDGILFEDLTRIYFHRVGKRNIHAVKIFNLDELDALSPAEVLEVRQTWAEHGRKTASQIRNYSHDFCPEYFELERGRKSIQYIDILQAGGIANCDSIADEIASYRELIDLGKS